MKEIDKGYYLIGGEFKPFPSPDCWPSGGGRRDYYSVCPGRRDY